MIFFALLFSAFIFANQIKTQTAKTSNSTQAYVNGTDVENKMAMYVASVGVVDSGKSTSTLLTIDTVSSGTPDVFGRMFGFLVAN